MQGSISGVRAPAPTAFADSQARLHDEKASQLPRLRRVRLLFGALRNVALFLSIGENRFITDLWHATAAKSVSEEAQEGCGMFATGCADEFAPAWW